MAERRMFAKTIIDSDAFIDMPLSAQALYFHLSMRADDEGFVNNPKVIMRTIGASTDDFKLLMAKQFVLTFETGIIVIKHWKIHNYIRADRLNETACVEEKSMLDILDNGEYQLLSEPLLESNISAEEKRKLAYKNSSLPYSFTYKIKRAFSGKPCPSCGFAMSGEVRKPTIQHNVPISQGGEHELENISVICHNCNVSIRDKVTGAFNNDEVIKMWDKIMYAERHKINWFYNTSVLDDIDVSQVTDICPSDDGIGKDSIGKDSIDKSILIDSKESICSTEAQQVVDAWNELGINPIRDIKPNTTRYSLFRARIKQYNLDDILTAISNIRESDFLMGQNKTGWTIKFDWFIKPNNFQKVLEGNYKNTQKQSTGSAWLDRIDNAVNMVDDFYVVGQGE